MRPSKPFIALAVGIGLLAALGGCSKGRDVERVRGIGSERDDMKRSPCAPSASLSVEGSDIRLACYEIDLGRPNASSYERLLRARI